MTDTGTTDWEAWRRSEDEQHLRLLAIFHYVVGGLACLFACFPIIHLVIGVAVMAQGGGEGALVGTFFVVIALAIILAGWALGAAIVYAGVCLGNHMRHTYCLVMAAVECIFMPVGTVLGILTIIVLMRPSVKRLFGVMPAGYPPDAGASPMR